jgi:hypothetical protein
MKNANLTSCYLVEECEICQSETNYTQPDNCQCLQCPMCGSNDLRFVNPPSVGDEAIFCNNCQEKIFGLPFSPNDTE